MSYPRRHDDESKRTARPRGPGRPRDGRRPRHRAGGRASAGGRGRRHRGARPRAAPRDAGPRRGAHAALPRDPRRRGRPDGGGGGGGAHARGAGAARRRREQCRHGRATRARGPRRRHAPARARRGPEGHDPRKPGGLPTPQGARRRDRQHRVGVGHGGRGRVAAGGRGRHARRQERTGVRRGQRRRHRLHPLARQRCGSPRGARQRRRAGSGPDGDDPGLRLQHRGPADLPHGTSRRHRTGGGVPGLLHVELRHGPGGRRRRRRRARLEGARMPISPADPHPRRRIRVLDTELSYVDTGSGDPTVFLHGNPTSSYLWRNVIPHVAARGRCLAPDLVGMGESGHASGGSYRFVDHARYLDAWFDALRLDRNVTLVVHDWGSALGFHWARRHPERVRGIAYMEAIVRPMTWNDWPEPGRMIFRAMRSAAGEEIVLVKNVFVERLLPASVMRGLGPEEMERYRAPYREPGESRRPTLTWPRQIPLDGEPADVVEIAHAYADWLTKSPVPKLFVNGDPGFLLTGALRAFCRTFPNQQEVTVRGTHFVQEDSPDEIGRAVADFVARLS